MSPSDTHVSTFLATLYLFSGYLSPWDHRTLIAVEDVEIRLELTPSRPPKQQPEVVLGRIIRPEPRKTRGFRVSGPLRTMAMVA